MNALNVRVKADISLPINQPDYMGRVFSADALVNAAKNMQDVPIVVNGIEIGVVEAAYVSSVSDTKINLRVYGRIEEGDVACKVSCNDSNVITECVIEEVSLFG